MEWGEIRSSPTKAFFFSHRENIRAFAYLPLAASAKVFPPGESLSLISHYAP